MGVDVEIQGEGGNRIDYLGDPDDILSEALPSSDGEYTWLSTIDRWANTTFNSLQVRRLLPEIERRADEVDPRAAAALAEVRQLALRVRDEAHLYLKFIGD